MDIAENKNKIDFNVPKSGSLLFDLHAEYLARQLIAKFPGLQYEIFEKEIHIFGELNDYWFEKFNQTVFKIGVLEN